MNYEYYTYRIDFADGKYYYGLKKLHDRLPPDQDGYLGTPHTNKQHWDENICCKTVLFVHEDRQEAAITEEILIGDRWKTDPLCLNAASGGKAWVNANTGRKLSPEQVEQMRERSKLFRHTPESKRKIAEANRRRIWTEESRRKCGEKNKGRKLTEEHRRKIGERQEGKPLSELHKDAIRRAKLGKKPTEEHKQNVLNGQRGKNKVEVSVINTGEVQIFNSINAVCMKLFGSSGIRKRIVKAIREQKSVEGYKFKMVNH